MKTAVGYSRFSCIKQADRSTIQTQHDAIEQYCLRNKFTLLMHFSDYAISGKEASNRDEFQKMIRYIVEHHVDYVIVYTRDRFSRNIKDFIKYMSIIMDVGCELKVVNESLDEHTPSGRFNAWIMMSLAQYYIDNLSRETLRGLRYNAYNCICNGIAPPGYVKDKITKKLVIDEDEGYIIQLIFDRYCQTKNVAEVVSYLNEHGYKRKNGKCFAHATVHRMLSNRIYIGEYRYEIRKGNNPELIVIPNGVPSLIDKSKFEKVQNILKSNEHKKKKNPCKGLLDGKLYCGYTLTLMRTVEAKRNSNTDTSVLYYMHTKRKNTIYANNISCQLLDDFVSLLISKVLLSERYEKDVVNTLSIFMDNIKPLFLEKCNEDNKLYIEKKKELHNLILDGKKSIDEISTDDIISKVKLEEEVNRLESIVCLNNDAINKIMNNTKDIIKINIKELRISFMNDRRSVISSLLKDVLLFNDNFIIEFYGHKLIPYLPSNHILYCEFNRTDIEDMINKILYKKFNYLNLRLRRKIINE